jgi:hypothetical protein
LALEQEYGTQKLLEVARWAAEKGMSVGKAIGAVRGALPKWGQPKQTGAARGSPSEPAGWQGIREYMAEEGLEWPHAKP